jgi:hypothetical protein
LAKAAIAAPRVALLTVVWLRYVVIADQLGIHPDVSAGTFGRASGGVSWSRVTPTIVLNILILGTVSGMVPNVHAEGEVGLGFHGQVRLDSPAPQSFISMVLRTV